MVINVTTRHSRPVIPAIFRTIMPKGTKVIRATSLVINMLPKKHRKTSRNTMPRSD